ncbi:MAG: AsmA family protein, partial [Saprospiraceae bacterium]
MKIAKKIARWMAILLLLLLAVFILLWLALQSPKVQTYVTSKITEQLSQTLGTDVRIGKVDIKFFKTISLQDVFIADQQNDTLVYAGAIDANIGILSLSQSQVFLNSIELENAVVKLNRPATDSIFNFAFLNEAFAKSDTLQSAKVDTTTSEGGWIFGIGSVLLENIDFKFDDDYAGMNVQSSLASAEIDFEEMNLVGQTLKAEKLQLSESKTSLRQSKPSKLYLENNKDILLDTSELAFPYFGWNFKVDQLDIEESRFQFENFADTVMTVNSLNVNDMDFQKMNL